MAQLHDVISVHPGTATRNKRYDSHERGPVSRAAARLMRRAATGWERGQERAAAGVASRATPLCAGAVDAWSSSSGRRLTWNARTIRVTPTATAQMPATV